MKINQWIVLAGMAAMMSLGTSQVLAQPNSGGQRGPSGRGGRGFDPAQMQQRIMERYKEMLEITNDDEWKAIEPRVQKVMELRRESFSGMGRGTGVSSIPPGRNNPNSSENRRQPRLINAAHSVLFPAPGTPGIMSACPWRSTTAE